MKGTKELPHRIPKPEWAGRCKTDGIARKRPSTADLCTQVSLLQPRLRLNRFGHFSEASALHRLSERSKWVSGPSDMSYRQMQENTHPLHFPLHRLGEQLRFIAQTLMPNGRGGGIRTPDPLVPNQMRYQTALRPDSY